jgi:hypothetical protein
MNSEINVKFECRTASGSERMRDSTRQKMGNHGTLSAGMRLASARYRSRFCISISDQSAQTEDRVRRCIRREGV